VLGVLEGIGSLYGVSIYGGREVLGVSYVNEIERGAFVEVGMMFSHNYQSKLGGPRMIRKEG